MTRENWIDWAKAFGILFVVMGHSSYAYEDVGKMIFMIHMPLFFFISGYLFKTNKNYKELSLNSWKSLCIPYLLYNLIFAIFTICTRMMKLIIGGNVDWTFSFINPLWHTLLGVANGIFDGPTWFLLALVWCKYLTHALHTSKSIYTKIGVLGLWGALFTVRILSGIQFVFAIDCALVGFIWFEAGHLIKLNVNRFTIPYWSWLLFVPVGFFVCYWLLQTNGQCNYIIADFKGPFGLIATGMGLIGFFGLCKLFGRMNSKVILNISKASIVIMCLHMLIQGTIASITHYQGGMLTTLVGDIVIVLALTAIYPLIQKYIPAFTGGRK